MKNRSFFILLFALSLIVPLYSSAFEQHYAAFSVKALLTQSGALSVNEQFIFDYGIEEKHGIIRTIPLILAEGGRSFLFDAISVTDKNSSPYQYSISKGGNIATIKIGNPSIVLTGTHYYDVKYTLSHIGSLKEATWKIVMPMKESISRFQADFFLPIPVPVQTSTSTCAFEPDAGTCVIIPLSKSGLVAGYRIAANGLTGQGITMRVTYPFGLVTEEKKSNVPSIALMVILLGGFISLSYVIFKYKQKILLILKKILKKKRHPDEFSYLGRAIAYRNEITPKDLMATLCDLEHRGYISLTSTNDSPSEYVIERASEDTPPGPESIIFRTLGDDPIMLIHWYTEIYPSIKEELLLEAKNEVGDIVLLSEPKHLPQLPNFELQ